MPERRRTIPFGSRHFQLTATSAPLATLPDKGFFDLGDIAALVDPDVASWEVVDCPEVDWDLNYRFKKSKGKILRCKDVDRDKTYALLNDRLRHFSQERQ